MKLLFIIIAILILIISFILLLKGEGKAVKLLNENSKPYENGISTREKVLLNGVEQYIFIVGKNINNPILLFLHGGPGFPELPLACNKGTDKQLEDKFTVCYWEQRGAGLSYTSKEDIKNLTVEEIVDNGIELSDYLRKRFNQEKIYLMGHSWGTFLGIKILWKKPEYFKAYFGIGQISDQTLSESIGYVKLLESAEKKKNNIVLKRLRKININALNFLDIGYLELMYKRWLNKGNIGIQDNQFRYILKVVKDRILFSGYSFLDTFKYIKGMYYSSKYILPLIYDENLMQKYYEFEMPMYFFHGIYDNLVSYELAYDYYEKIKAPRKDFFTFYLSEHSPQVEEAERFTNKIFSLLDKLENNVEDIRDKNEEKYSN
ncbi:MAG: alpha/beta hydrolase [Miniphocaeibacter sp.]|uniref:alpha/beta fold hydrolase n=1 Tax=Miniphocaeibacter sp. TaxID=3100973 RepID=UPI00183853DF|nr:alpha/beta hydrolase [Gallicola sp.]